MEIRKYQKSDWSQVWPIIEKVFRSGEAYPFSPDITEQEAHEVWIETPQETYIAITGNGEILGTYYIKPNHSGPGSHVCNCGYIVSESFRRKGVASRMCEHSQQVAVELGFHAMQYNLVVSTNEAAIRAWKKLGFDVIGKLPKAFKSKSAGYVDALVMYKELNTQNILQDGTEMAIKDDNLKLYEEYNKTLRTWLVGFGFGVPALFIVNEAAQKKLIASPNAEFIVWLFLSGAGVQVLIALTNKIISWCAYHKHNIGEEKCPGIVKKLASLEHAFYIDVITDFLSLILFGWSIILIMSLFF